MFSRKTLFSFFLIILCPLSLNVFLNAKPQNRPGEYLPPPSHIQQNMTPLPEIETQKETLQPLNHRDIISWSFRVARKHPFL